MREEGVGGPPVRTRDARHVVGVGVGYQEQDQDQDEGGGGWGSEIMKKGPPVQVH